MKFTCEKALLVSALSVASRTVAQKSTIPCLEGVLLRAGVALQLTGYNLETGITVHVGAQIQEAGSCVMPARLFFDIVRKLPDEMVSITVDHKQQVSIRAGAAFFQITAMDSEDYPELPDVNGKSGVTMPQSALKAMISGTIFSVSENQARPIQTGCLMEVTEDSVTMVAVDSFRLARRTWHTENAANHTLKFVVPAAGLKEIERILEDSDEPVTFTLGDKHILFSIGDALLVSRVLEGEFIDWRRVVPTNCGTVLTANVAELTSSIERVSLIISEKVKSPVRCVFGDNMADFRTANTIGSAHDTCSIAGNGGELEIGFNSRYLLDALRVIPSEEVTLELQNGLSPIVFTPCDKKYDFAYMVLPEYDLRMAQTGALVISYRARYVKALAQEAARYHREFSGDSETLELTYRTVSTVTDPFAPPETLCAQLQEHQRSHARAELESAQCLSGPHKDDFEAVINGLPVAQFASQGQTRTAVISLKLAERALLRQGTGETPVLLLDDVLSELDAGRQDFVLNQLREGQVFITCCETDRLTSLGQVLSIRSGTIGGAQ